MNIRKICLLAAAVLTLGTSVRAQTAEEIIDKHLAAIGGKEKLKGLNSLRMEAAMEVMGNEAPSVITVVNGKGYRSQSEFNGQQIIQVVTDKGGWSLNPMAGAVDPQEMTAEQYKAMQGQIWIIPFLDYSARGNKAELLGQEKVGSVNAYKVRMTNKDGQAITYYFDPATWYLTQVVQSAEVAGQSMELVSSLSDYQKTEYGYVVPRTMDMNFNNQFSITTRIKKVEVNPTVDTALFEMKK